MDPFFQLKKKNSFKKIYKKYYFKGDIHLNSEGNKIIAEEFLVNYR